MAAQSFTTRKSVSGCESQYKYKPQMNSIAGAVMPIMASGIYFIWGVYASAIAFASSGEVLHAIIAFYIAVAVGACFGQYLSRKYRKAIIYYFAGILTIISGIIKIPHYSEPIFATTISRYIGGVAVGVSLITAVIHGAEVAVKNFRGVVVGGISLCAQSSVLTAALLLGLTYKGDISIIEIERIFGGLICGYGVLGIIFVFFVTYESPIFLMQNNQEFDALKTMMKLRRESTETWELHEDLVDIKEMVKEDAEYSKSILEDDNTRPLLRMIALRLLYNLSNSLVLNWYLLSMTELIFGKFGITYVLLARLFAESVILFTIEKIGRRLLLFISCIISGLILLVGGIMYIIFYDIGSNIVLAVLVVAYSIALGVGLGPVSMIYISEAFPLRKKGLSLVVIWILENLLQIGIILFAYYQTINPTSFFIIIGTCLLVFGVYFYKYLPETKNLSLKECKNIMKKL